MYMLDGLFEILTPIHVPGHYSFYIDLFYRFVRLKISVLSGTSSHPLWVSNTATASSYKKKYI